MTAEILPSRRSSVSGDGQESREGGRIRPPEGHPFRSALERRGATRGRWWRFNSPARGDSAGGVGSSGVAWGRVGNQVVLVSCFVVVCQRHPRGQPPAFSSESPLGVSPRPKTSLHFVQDNVTGKRPHSRFETGNLVSKKTSMVGVAQIGETLAKTRGHTTWLVRSTCSRPQVASVSA